MTRKQAYWKEISPGVYSRSIPEDERQVDMQFVQRIAETVGSSCLRLLILQTGERSWKSRQVKKPIEPPY